MQSGGSLHSTNREEEEIVQNSIDFGVWGLKQVVLRIFTKPVEEFFPGVRKSSQPNRPMCYHFLPMLVGAMTAERYFGQMGAGGFPTKYRLNALFVADGQLIKLEGAGGIPYDLPRIIFLGDGGVQLWIPNGLNNSRDWDDIALELASLFGKQ